MDARSSILVLVLLYLIAIAVRGDETTTKIGKRDVHSKAAKRHLLLVKREEDEESSESGSDELAPASMKRSIQDDQHRPINDDTDSLGSLVGKLHKKRCARTTTTAATTTTVAAG